MKILVTGSPGTGKTSIAKELGKQLGCPVVNEKEFAFNQGIGEWDAEANELVLDTETLEAALKKYLENKKNIIVEGHLLCETKIPADKVIVLSLDPELLQERLSRRNYSMEKVMDNVFCEGIDYCKKHVKKRYPREKIIETENRKTIKETTQQILIKLKEAKA